MKIVAPTRSRALLVAGSVLFSVPALAQETTQDILGTVVDAATKKPVADVVVTATSPAQAGEETVVTDKAGKYRIPKLKPGVYTLRFEREAYRPFSRGDLNLRAGANLNFSAELLPDAGFTEEIVITGSRIPRVELQAAAPVSVLGRQKLEASGRASVGDMLQQALPEQSNAINTQFNNGGDGSTRINLRGLGTGRTLVLLNGRRHVAGGTGADATVDLNTIPASAIQRIEVLKDGASAVYGSDAIAGVVNIITRKDFTGTEVSAFTGTSQQGDGTFYDLNLTTGQASERGNVLFSAGYYKAAPVWAGDRDFSYFDRAYNWNSRRISTRGSVGTPNGLFGASNDSAGNAAWDSLLNEYPDHEGYFTLDNGSWRPFDFSGVTEAGGDYYNYQPENYLATPQQRAHIFALGNVKLGENTGAFFEASYTNRQSSQKLAPEPLFTTTEGIVVSKDNHYNPFNRDFDEVYRRLSEFGNRDYAQDLDTFRIVTGVKNTRPEQLGFLKNVHWELSVNYGRTQGVETKAGFLQRSKVAAALGPSFIDEATGQARCGTPDAPVADCVPLNVFGGAGSITPDMKENLSYKGTARGFNQQAVVMANASSELFTIPRSVSPVAIAVGYEFRREAGANTPDPLTAKGDTTGNKSTETAGSFRVNEAYMELSVPLFGRIGGSAGDALELSAATRMSQYNTFGNALTYKLGSRINVIPNVTLRGTLSSAFRAPSIAQLYQGGADAFPTFIDPCSNREQGTVVDQNCDAAGVPDSFKENRSQVLSRVGGNKELQPETANVFTVGAVYQPSFIKDLSLTADYYNFKVQDAIAAVGTDVILASCYANENPEYCDRITRNDRGAIQVIQNPLSNVGGDRTSGVDFAIRYDPSTRFGQFGLSADIGWLHNFDRTLAGGRVVKARNTYDLGVYVDWKANLGLSWSMDAFSAGTNLRWLNGFQECQGNSCQVKEGAPAPLSRRVEAYYTVDANFGYRFSAFGKGNTMLSAGVNNLLNRAPARVYNGFLGGSDASTYDYMGRFFYTRLTHNFN